jgi:hypothetical protein
MSDPNASTGGLSSTLLELCAKVRNDDTYVLPEPGKPFRILHLSEKAGLELGNALRKNTTFTHLELTTCRYTKRYAEALAKYMSTSKCLQRIRWNGDLGTEYRELQQREEILCCFLPALQESTSLKELDINFPLTGGPSSLPLESLLTHTLSLRSLSLSCPTGQENIAAAAARSGLIKNTTLQELTLTFSQGSRTASPILTSLRDHPLLRRLCYVEMGWI